MSKLTLRPVITQALSTLSILLAIFLLLFFRNPRLFIYPEPWAEDMAIFLGQEYNLGFPETAFTLYAGYIHLLPRIIAWIAMKFDWSDVMIVMNWAVALIKIMTFYLIYKSREITSPFLKFTLIAYLILQPFVDEIYNNVTNLQWWLIFLMAVVIIRQETSLAGMIFSVIVLILTGLTGVNSVMFAIPCAYMLLKVRTRDGLIKNSIVIGCALVQFYCLYTSGRSGNGKIVYAGGGNLLNDIINLFTNRVIYHAFADFSTINSVNIIVFLLYTFCLVSVVYYYRKMIAVQFIFLFSAVYFAVILYNFLKSSPDLNFISGQVHERYFAYLKVCTVALLMSSLNLLFRWLLSIRNYKRLMTYSCYLVCLTVLKYYPACPYSFGIQYYEDVQKFEHAKSGEIVRFHYPLGWTTDLTKK